MPKKNLVTRVEWDLMWTALGDDWYFEDGPDEDEDALFADGYVDESLFDDAYLGWQGQGDPRAVEPYIRAADVRSNGCTSLLAALRRWRKWHSTATMVVEYDKSKMSESAARLALKAAGFKVV